MTDRRHLDRLKTTNGALIFFDRKRGVFSCALRDINDVGIGLRLDDPDVIAPAFKITTDNFASVQSCQVVWSRGRYIGATFSADPPADERP